LIIVDTSKFLILKNRRSITKIDTN